MTYFEINRFREICKVVLIYSKSLDIIIKHSQNPILNSANFTNMVSL